MGVGPSAEVIEAFANEVAADLVVVGTSGATGIRRAALGSVADGVLRRFACDIAVPPAGEAPPGSGLTPPRRRA